MRWLRIAFLVFMAVCSLLSMAGMAGAAEDDTIIVIEVDGTIVPVVAQYVERGVTLAEDSGATALVIQLNTPGGLLTATEDIVSTILNAEVPVVTYVSPQGAWAASAGTFITLASHVAAMAPGTTIGAAHPVSGGGQEIPEDQLEKITEFSAKWMRTIAETRGRNLEEAELAVRESKSFTDSDALKANLIDMRADTLSLLLEEIDGTQIELADGRTVTLETADAAVQIRDMTPFERLLHTITDPNVAYILFTLATIGLVTEISSPGLIIPGVVGGICLILAFYALGVLDANFGGIALMLMAIGLFVAESLEPKKVRVRRAKLPEEASPWDLFARDGKIYVLASLDKGEGSEVTNVIYESNDAVRWRELARFTSPTFARSFETIDGAWYVALGCKLENPRGKWSHGDISPDTGRLLRIPAEAITTEK